jgi:translation initiation factor 2-alpha kinase 4
VAEGITEDEGWRLFQQILDALVHMSGLGIVSQTFITLCYPPITMQLHRDIKLTNIFIGEFPLFP